MLQCLAQKKSFFHCQHTEEKKTCLKNIFSNKKKTFLLFSKKIKTILLKFSFLEVITMIASTNEMIKRFNFLQNQAYVIEQIIYIQYMVISVEFYSL